MRGDVLAAAIKAASPTTKIVMITADIAMDDLGMGSSVDSCLINPFPLGDLLVAVSTLLSSNERVR